MQKTKLDRWLQKRFALETHVYTMRPCARRPRGFRYRELPEGSDTRYRHLYITRKEKLAQRLIDQLRNDSMMFNTRVVDRTGLLPSLLAPKNKSVFYTLVWTVIFGILTVVAANLGKKLWSNPKVRENVQGAFEVLKG